MANDLFLQSVPVSDKGARLFLATEQPTDGGIHSQYVGHALRYVFRKAMSLGGFEFASATALAAVTRAEIAILLSSPAVRQLVVTVLADTDGATRRYKWVATSVAGTGPGVIAPSAAGTGRWIAEELTSLVASRLIAWEATWATTGALPACTYANGTAGEGATLTGNAPGALPAQDGQAIVAGQIGLVKNQVNAAHNGLYVVTTVGGAAAFVLTRLPGADTAFDLRPNLCCAVMKGTANGDSIWMLTADPTIVVGTTDLVWSRQSVDWASVSAALAAATSRADFNEQHVLCGGLELEPGANLTISGGGAVTPTHGYHKVIAAGAPAADNLDTITGTNFVAGGLLLLSGLTAGDVITLRHAAGGGNIRGPNGSNVEIGVTVNDWALLIYDGTNWYVVAHSRSDSSVRFGTGADAITLAAGSMTPSGVGYVRVATEAAAVEDDLDTIVTTNYLAGQCLLLAPATAGQIVILTNAGNIDTPDGRDLRLGYSIDDRILLEWDGAAWQVIATALSVGTASSIKTHDAFQGSQSVVLTAAGQTTDATPLDLWTLAVPDETALWLEADVIGRSVAGSTSENAYKIHCLVQRRAAGAASIGAAGVVDMFTDEETLAWACTFVVNANNVILRVTGDVPTTSLAWAATIRYQAVGGVA